MALHAGYILTGFGYYGCFHPAWYAAHPGCWVTAGWAANAAWSSISYRHGRLLRLKRHRCPGSRAGTFIDPAGKQWD
jgi:hypothetical protein